MNVDVVGAVAGVNGSLVFFNRAECEDDVIMHESKCLTGLVVCEDAGGIDLVLRLGENSDPSVTPVRVRTVFIVGNNVLSLVCELGVFIEIDALSKQMLVKEHIGWYAL